MTNITVFNNNTFVDTRGSTFGESENVQAAFSSFGHTVSTFIATDGPGLTTAFAGQDIVAFPEFENGTWRPSGEAQTAIVDFVTNGGTLIKFGYTGGNADFLNATFGFEVVERFGAASTITPLAQGSAFDGGPSDLPSPSGTDGLLLSSLPAEAFVYYETATLGTVLEIPVGAGKVTYIGWDWFDGAPRGGSDGGWLDVLERATLNNLSSGIAVNDVFATDDDTSILSNVFDDNGAGADDATNGPLTVTALNGESSNVGASITLASGAVVTLGADGALSYVPSEALPAGETSRDRLTYDIEDSAGNTGTASVTVQVTGFDNDDLLIGTDRNDVLQGGLGNDRIETLGGDDILVGDSGAGLSGDDVLDGGEGTDRVAYATATAGVTVDLRLDGIPQDTIAAGTDTLFSIEEVFGSSFDDTLTGSAGDNYLLGGAGNDTMTGGAGDDTYSVEDVGDVVVELAGEGRDTVLASIDYTLPTEIEVLHLVGADSLTGIGNGADNELKGNAGDNVLQGGAGNDILSGLNGADTLDGGDGYDRAELFSLFVGITVDLSLGTGSGGDAEGDRYIDIEDVRATYQDDTLIGSDNAEQFRGRGGNDSLFGAGGDDILLGGSGVDIMRGDAGADRLYGQRGDDTMFGGDGIDRLRGHQGDDTMSGGNDDDDLRGGTGSDTMLGGNGADFLMGQYGADAIFGEDGNDFVRGGGLGDFIDGGADDDILYGQTGNDEIDGGTGTDKVRGNDGDDILRGGAGNDDLRGGLGADSLSGDAGDDFLVGGAGEDRLFGGAGRDSMFGGVDRDTFIFTDAVSGGGGFDRIKDWEDGVDVIDLTAFGFTDFTTDVLSIVGDRAAGLRINFGDGDVLFVEGFLAADFDASDVIL